jgi:hypothetical protein
MAQDHTIMGWRRRRVPRSGLPRDGIVLGLLAEWHDLWLDHRTRARWREEILSLDPRIARDVGLERAVYEVKRAADRQRNFTFPPQNDRAVAKVAHKIGT